MKVSNSKERIAELLKITGDTQSDMVRKSGVEKSALSHYLHGTREPRQDKIAQIAIAYNVNPAWLMGFDVPMKNDYDSDLEKRIDQTTQKMEKFYNRYQSSSAEVKKIIEDLLHLKDEL